MTPVLEPGIGRKSQIETTATGKDPSKNEDDLINTYYKLRRELEELKEKKATKIHKKSIEGDEIEVEKQVPPKKNKRMKSKKKDARK